MLQNNTYKGMRRRTFSQWLHLVYPHLMILYADNFFISFVDCWLPYRTVNGRPRVCKGEYAAGVLLCANTLELNSLLKCFLNNNCEENCV